VRRLSLNGASGWHLPPGPMSTIDVPSCHPFVGEAVFEKEFDIDRSDHERAFLCLEGIHYTGQVSLNGRVLGGLLPYVPYLFEIASIVRPDENKLVVSVKDITADYGPTGGWEDDGSIGRDVARTIEIADRVGLMLSEVLGLWWSDMTNRAITDSALEIMRRTILRDRNNPSVIAWLFFNEGLLKDAKGYLQQGRALCQALDPSRLVSGANCVS